MSWNTKKRSGAILCYPFEQKRLDKWQPPYITQPKLDGVRCRALRTPEGWLLLSSTEDIIISVPHILETLINMAIPEELNELDGELYVHGYTFEEIFSITSRTVNLHPDSYKMEYHVFDNIEDITPQANRLVSLNVISFNDIIIRVPHRVSFTFNDVMDDYRQYLDMGYEGIIIRHFEAPYIRRRSIFLMKFKPKKSDWYEIVGFIEEHDKFGNPKDRLGAFILSGNEGTRFNVGSGFTEQQRIDYWKDKTALIGRICVVEYQHITSGRGVPRFPIYVEIKEPF